MSVYGRRRLAVLLGMVIVAGAVGAGVYFGLDALRGEEAPPEAPAPRIVIQKQQPQATEDLGFPAFATKNTTRVAGADPITDAAGVALAVFPSAGGIEGPAAVSLVEASDWQSGVAAAVLAGPPVRAPILLTGSDSLPALSADALRALAPQGADVTGGDQIFRIGDAFAPTGPRTLDVDGGNPAEIGDAIDRLRQKLTSAEPDAIVLATSDDPAYAMPAAAWAARSGDPVLFLGKNAAPKPTLEALQRHKGVPVYVLGPSSVISAKALAQVRKVAPGVKRIGGEDPVTNAIAFARYVDGGFGWDINDPGHGFVIASDSRPLDAAAAAPLSASGTWGPLLVTDDAAKVPPDLHGYLLDLKPGYLNDPTRAVYNHVWLIGDTDAISVAFQAQVDDLAEVTPVRSGAGGGPVGSKPGTPENENQKKGP